MRFDRCRKAMALCLALSPWAALPADSAETGWRKEVFNPQPQPDDIFLPLPCGGSMALRKVVTNQGINRSDTGAPLLDREFSMGRVGRDALRGFMENRREEYIAGPIGTASENYYLIGKYEVSSAQYEAVIAKSEAECPRMAPAQALPKTDISWYDAIDFSRRLNAWLYAGPNGLAALVALGITDGYVRLPSETEWEFAARGGLAVSDAERANERFPMEEGLDNYAWHNAPQSAQGRVKPIGTRKLNPLGLADVYGNAAEIVLDPFRMTRADRLHGRIGGYVVRGGSFLDDAGKLNSAVREELPFFSQVTQGEFHVRTTGLRIVVGTAALSADLDVGRLEAAVAAVQSQPSNTLAPDAAARLGRLAQQTENAGLKRQLDALRMELAAEFARRNDIEERQIRGAILNAGLMARELQLASRALENIASLLQDTHYDGREQDQRSFDAEKANFDMFRRRYTDAIQSLATIAAARVPTAAERVTAELQARDSEQLAPFVRMVQRQVRAYARGEVTETREVISGVIGRDKPWN
ncbi:formylglycine-generating enzyme family protein [Ancylobacter tetraedralis]